MTPSPTIPGRGAWTKTGGLPRGYYELVDPNIGSTPNVNFHHYAVMLGVKAIQERINRLYYPLPLTVDGWFGAKTDVAVRWVQGRLGITVDGVIGPQTGRALFVELAKNFEQQYGVPGHLVCGGVTKESAWDPGAQGYDTPFDLGLEQKNVLAYPVSYDSVYDAVWALRDFASELAAAYKHYLPDSTKPWQTSLLRMQCTAGHHFAPTWADYWWSHGKTDHVDLVTYANKVLELAKGF